MRLRQLGIAVGQLQPGPLNAVVDVAGVGVGQVEITEQGLCTGITAVVPYPPGTGERQLFVGIWSLDNGQTMTGLGVAEDFGVFSSPILLAPAPALGRVYDGLIRDGLGRNPALSVAAGWPPVVVGLDDTWSNPPALTHRLVGQTQLAQALATAGTSQVQEGNAGIGHSLCAFGVKGGVGTASRRCPATGGPWTVGALVAANSGEPAGLCVDRYPVGRLLAVRPVDPSRPRDFAAVVATDAPLISEQLRRLAGRAALGLARVGLLDEATRQGVALAFSTQATRSEQEGLAQLEMAGEETLPALFAAAAEACEEAVLNALLSASPTQGLGVLPVEGWSERVRQHQQASSPE